MVKVIDARTTQAKEFATTVAYDASLLKTTITDPAAKSITYTHNSAGNLIKTEDAEGIVKTFEWDKNNPIKVTDAKGSTSATYDSKGNVTSVSDTLTESSNATTTAQYDSLDNPITVTDPVGNQVTAKYDSKSNLLSTANPERKEADANTYDSYGNIASSTDAGAPTYNMLQNGSFEFTDANGAPLNWYLGGNTAAISIDGTTSRYGNRSAKISSSTQTTAYLYSRSVSVAAGQKLTLSVPVNMGGVTGTGGVDIGLEFYDPNGNFKGWNYSNIYIGYGNTCLTVTADVPTGAAYAVAVLEMRDAKGTVWFDGAQLESPLNDTEGHILTKFDYVENSSFESGGTYWYAGGPTGSVSISTEAPWAGTRSAKINLTSSNTAWVKSANIPVRAGEPLTLSGFVKTNSIAGSGTRVQVQYYNSSNTYLGLQATTLQTGTKDYTRYALAVTPQTGTAYAVVYGAVYSSTGTACFDNLKLVPRATTTYTYDSGGNYLKDVVDPLGNWTNYEYDTAGNRTLINDPKGYITRFAYDANDNLTQVTDPYNNVSRYDYDPVSMQVTYLDARSASETDTAYKTSFGYNELNQLISTIDPLGRETTNTYGDAGNLAQTAFPDGRKVLFSYDQANRLKEKSYSAETTKFTYSYDSAGNLSQVQDNNQRSFLFTYDKANRLTSLTDIFNYTLNYGFDSADNITSIIDSNNKSITFGYGSANQLLNITDPSGRQTKFRYDEAGRLFEIVRGSGGKSTYLYDDAGRIWEIGDPGNPGGIALNYAYDANGNITIAGGADGEELFSYDKLNRLTSWTSDTGTVTSYEYDKVGNLTKKGNKTFTYNAANEIANSGFTYNQNGNLTSDGNFNYEYDTEGHLTKVTKVSDGSTVATYEYDYRGLRISKTTSSGTVRYHWDNKDRLVRESDTSGNTIALYIYSDKDQLIAIEKNGQMYYTHTNHRGDILAITDSNKQRVATFKYGPWGELISQSGTFDIPFRYAGYYFDSETGLYYLKARYYSPEFGRFLTKDTVKGVNDDPRTLNLYAYAEGNPIMNVDPDGHAAWSAKDVERYASYRTSTLGCIYTTYSESLMAKSTLPIVACRYTISSRERFRAETKGQSKWILRQQ